MTQVTARLTTKRVTAAMDAMKSRDRSRIDQYWDPNVRFLVPGSHPYAGWREGLDDFIDFHRKLVEISGGTIRMSPYAVLVNEEDGYSAELNECTAQRAGSLPDSTSPYDRLNFRAVDILRWVNGRVVEGCAGIFGDGMTAWNLFLSPISADGKRTLH